MNDFFKYDFNITQIVACVKVHAGQGEKKHRNRPFHGLIFQCGGTAEYDFFEKGGLSVESGRLFYLPRFSDYDASQSKDTGVCIAVNFQISGEDTFPQFSLPAKYDEKYRRKFEKLLTVYGSDRQGRSSELKSILYGIIADIQSDAAASYISPKSDKTVSECVKIIEERLCDPILTVEAIAAELNISPEYLRRLFGSVYGISPKKYIVAKRIELAKSLIISGEVKLTEIGYMCGFNNVGWFCTEFKAQTGMSPSEYRLFFKTM